VISLDLDLASPASVRSCAAAFVGLKLRLSALVLNAGINGLPRWGQLTPGVESQFAINFLGHTLLASELHACLAASPGARLVILGSESHRRVAAVGFDLERELPPREERYDSLHAYAFSNLCRLLWARAYSGRVSYPVLCLHPGVIAGTGMMQHMTLMDSLRQVCLAFWHEVGPTNLLMSVPAGARLQTWCAVAPLAEVSPLSGRYLCGNNGSRKPVEPSPLGRSIELAERVFMFAERWAKSV
jgi:hypothetical protein